MHFHVALAAASGNALLRETVEALLHVRAREQVEIRHRYNDRTRDHAEHVEIFEAVRDGDAEAPSGSPASTSRRSGTRSRPPSSPRRTVEPRSAPCGSVR